MLGCKPPEQNPAMICHRARKVTKPSPKWRRHIKTCHSRRHLPCAWKRIN
jgi:hypothetical protein